MKYILVVLMCVTLWCASVVSVSAQVETQNPSSGQSSGVITQNPGGSSGGSSGSSQLSYFPNPFGEGVNGPNSLIGFIEYVLKVIVMPIGSIVVVFYVIYTGYKFVTAQGDVKKLEEAKKGFYGVMIGAAILFGAVVIVEAVRATICQVSNNSIPDLCQKRF